MIDERTCNYLRTRLVEQLNELETEYITQITKSDYSISDRYLYRKAEITSGIRMLNIVLERKDILNYD